MSRAACTVGIILAAVCVAAMVTGALPEDRGFAVIDLVGVGAVALGAVVGFRGPRLARILMVAGAMVLLGRSLPAYFQTSAMWPYLAFIILSSATFGFGVLGILLEGYDQEKSTS